MDQARHERESERQGGPSGVRGWVRSRSERRNDSTGAGWLLFGLVLGLLLVCLAPARGGEPLLATDPTSDFGDRHELVGEVERLSSGTLAVSGRLGVGSMGGPGATVDVHGAAAVDRVTNGGFEDGAGTTATLWQYHLTVVDAVGEAARTGSRGLRLYGTGVWAKQAVTVAASTDYVLTYWDRGTGLLYVSVSDVAGSALVTAADTLTGADWTQRTVRFTTGASTAGVWVEFGEAMPGMLGYVDDVSMGVEAVDLLHLQAAAGTGLTVAQDGDVVTSGTVTAADFASPTTATLRVGRAHEAWLLAGHAIDWFQPWIAPGTTGQYWRGDKTWQTLPGVPDPIVPADGTQGITGNLVTDATYGSELNPTFPSVWVLTTGWKNPAVGTLNHNADGAGLIYLNVNITANTLYKIVITVSEMTVAGTVYMTVGGTYGRAMLTAGTYTSYVVAGTTAKLSITPASASRFKISAVSIKAQTAGTGDLTVGGTTRLAGGIRNSGGPIVVIADGSNLANQGIEVRTEAGSLVGWMYANGHIGGTYLDPVATLRTVGAGGYFEGAGRQIFSGLSNQGSPAAGDVLVLHSTASQSTKWTTAMVGLDKTIIGTAAFANGSFWTNVGYQETVNVDAGAVAVGQALAPSLTVDGRLRGVAYGDHSVPIVGYAYTAKAAGANGTVTAFIRPRDAVRIVEDLTADVVTATGGLVGNASTATTATTATRLACAKVDLVGQTADLTSSAAHVVTGMEAAGFWRLDVYLYGMAYAAGDVTLDLYWTDDAGAVHFSPTNVIATGFAAGVTGDGQRSIPIYKTAGPVYYTTSMYLPGGGSPQYGVRMRAVKEE